MVVDEDEDEVGDENEGEDDLFGLHQHPRYEDGVWLMFGCGWRSKKRQKKEEVAICSGRIDGEGVLKESRD